MSNVSIFYSLTHGSCCLATAPAPFPSSNPKYTRIICKRAHIRRSNKKKQTTNEHFNTYNIWRFVALLSLRHWRDVLRATAHGIPSDMTDIRLHLWNCNKRLYLQCLCMHRKVLHCPSECRRRQPWQAAIDGTPEMRWRRRGRRWRAGRFTVTALAK